MQEESSIVIKTRITDSQGDDQIIFESVDLTRVFIEFPASGAQVVVTIDQFTALTVPILAGLGQLTPESD